MKEQAKERNVESEEAREETSRRLQETRKAQFIAEPKPEVSVRGQFHEPQASPAKARITFNMPIKSMGRLEIPQPQPPYLKTRVGKFVKPRLLSTKAQPAAMITPTILVAPKSVALKDIMVPTLAQITIRRVVAPPLQLRLKQHSDISVRPLIRIEPVKDMGASAPTVKPARLAFQRPRLVPIPRKWSYITYVPRVRVITLKEEIEEERQVVMQASEHVGAVKERAGCEEPLLDEMESVFELFLDEKSGKGLGGAIRYSGESVYIVLEKPFIIKEHKCLDTLHYLCIRALREYLGEKAETRAFSSGYGKSDVEKYLGDRSITIVDEELFMKIDEKVDEKALADRLKNFSKGLSYIIFHVEESKARSLYQKLWSFRSTFHDKIFWIATKLEVTMDTMWKLAEVFWGFVDVPPSGSLDELFGAGKCGYYETLERVGMVVSAKPEKPYPIPRTNRLGPESREHLLLKKFLAKIFVDRPPEELLLSKIAREDRYKYIEFEKEWREENRLVAVSDAYLESDKIAVEVETLFEEGEYGGEPVAKIRDGTIEKYRQFKIPINELWIVMENMTMLKHLRELWGLRDLYRRWCEEGKISFQVKFFTLNLKDEKLIRMEELVSHLHKIIKEPHHNTADLPPHINTYLERRL